MEFVLGRPYKNLAGQEIGRLTVTDNTYLIGDVRWWTCECKCGNTKDVSAGALLAKRPTRSCGCLLREMAKESIKKAIAASTTHGKTYSPEYNAWCKMKDRCSENANAEDKAIYWDRGIRVCDEWLNSFEAFYAEVGDRPSPKHSIDRIDNDRNYEPGNVRWATKKQQRVNCRTAVMIEFAGKKQCMKDWATDLGISYVVLRQRYVKEKMPMAEIIELYGLNVNAYADTAGISTGFLYL